jgi:hypothetical protein
LKIKKKGMVMKTKFKLFSFLTVLSCIAVLVGLHSKLTGLVIGGDIGIIIFGILTWVALKEPAPQYICAKCGKATRKSKVNTGYNYQLELPTWTCSACGEVHVVYLGSTQRAQRGAYIRKEIV